MEKIILYTRLRQLTYEQLRYCAITYYNYNKNKRRKNPDYNAFELIFALYCCNGKIKNKNDVKNANFKEYSHVLKGCTETKFKKYLEDINRRKEIDIENYIKNIKSQLHNIVKEKIKYVYLEGKTVNTEKIKDLNKGVDIKKAKADIYIETISGKMIGISIKQNKNCQKGNYSVELMLGKLVDKNIRKELSDERKAILSKNDINSKNIIRERKKASKLFYNSLEGKNSYWNMLRKYINANIDKIKNALVDYMFPTDLQYELYEFNGNIFERLDKIHNNKIELYEYEDYYLDKKGNRRNDAKMYYRLIIYDKVYKLELRFKGNIWTSSAQFLIFNE